MGKQQFSFIPGRQGIDNVVIVQEIVHNMRKKTGNVVWMAIKLDHEKAYDKINWDFLWSLLTVVGFEATLIDLIMFCVTSASLLVLWNGEKNKAFQLSRELQ